ncbi:MAG: tetratricopeptide repeat protein [Thermomicrobiales bacterium]
MVDCLALLRRRDTRLVTLVGPGGVGKTRLAIEVAAKLIDDPAGSVDFVDLSPLDDPDLVVPTLARALGITESPEHPLWESLVSHLAETPQLIVLDTFEHLIAAAGDVADLLSAAADLKLLVTSRVPLRLRAERRFQVPSLPVPGRGGSQDLARFAQFPSVALFLDRAQAVDFDFALDGRNAPDIELICRHLDGLPLAIELAAARVDQSSISEISQQTARGLDRLANGPRDLPPRQQRLEQTIQWGYQHLDADCQSVLRQIATFTSGCSFEAIAATTDADHDPAVLRNTLGRLVACNLVLAETVPDGSLRHRLLDAVRAFVRGLASAQHELDSLLDHQTRYFIEFVEQVDADMETPEQSRTLDRVQMEYENIRGVLRWSLHAGNGVAAMRLATALWDFWEVRGYVSEGRSWLEQAVAAGEHVSPPLRARALTAAAAFADMQGDYDRAMALHLQALPIWEAAEDRHALARTYNNLGVVYDSKGDLDAAVSYYGAALAIHREDGDIRRVAIVLGNLGVVAFARGDYGRAALLHEESLAQRRALHDDQGIAAALNNLATAVSGLGDESRAEALLVEALTLNRAMGNRSGTASSLLNLGIVARRRGEFSLAERLLDEALSLQQSLGDKHMTAVLLTLRAEVACDQGDYRHAFHVCRDGLVLHRSIGNRIGIGNCLAVFARIAASLSDFDHAVQCLAAADAIDQGHPHVAHPTERAELERFAMHVRGRLGEARFQELWDRGRTLTLDVAAASALRLEFALG